MPKTITINGVDYSYRKFLEYESWLFNTEEGNKLRVEYWNRFDSRQKEHPREEPPKPEPVQREPKGIDPGYVYLLRCADTPYYKIGRTKQKDPEVRIRAIQGICPMEIVKLKVEKTGNTSSLEKYLHRRFKDNHHRYEWYTFKSKTEAERLFKEGIESFEKWRKGE